MGLELDLTDLVRISFDLVRDLVRNSCENPAGATGIDTPSASAAHTQPDAAPPLPPPAEDPPQETDPVKRCEDCGAKLDLSTQSVLPAYCKRCFAAEAALSRAGKLDNSRDACVLCAGKINADNKSPVPCCCFICYEQQSQVEDAIVAAGAAPVDQQAEDKVVADTDRSAEQKEVVAASLDGQRSDALECMPPGGWERVKKESEQDWFARIQRHRHRSQARSQKEYREQWKSFDNAHRERFRREIAALASQGSEVDLEARSSSCRGQQPALSPPWLQVLEGKRVIALPADFSVADLKAHFEAYAKAPSAYDQKRWEMYSLVHLLLREPGNELSSASRAQSDASLCLLFYVSEVIGVQGLQHYVSMLPLFPILNCSL